MIYHGSGQTTRGWDFGLLNAAQLQGCLKKLDEVATEGGLDEVATEGGLRRWQGR